MGFGLAAIGEIKTVPAVEIASATYKGSYEQLTVVNQMAAAWVQDNGYEFNDISISREESDVSKTLIFTGYGCVKLTVYQSTDNSTHPALYIKQRNRQYCDCLEKIGRK